MAITCTPEALVASSVCLDCLDDNLEAADIYLLCEWANKAIIVATDGILDTSGFLILDTAGEPILKA